MMAMAYMASSPSGFCRASRSISVDSLLLLLQVVRKRLNRPMNFAEKVRGGLLQSAFSL